MWVIPLKNKKGTTITNMLSKEFQMSLITNQTKYGQIKEVYNTSMKTWFQVNYIKMYSKHNDVYTKCV